ncbi:MAG: hypothetical protein ACU83O_01215 [Gammaproteobacteria bacterium]
MLNTQSTEPTEIKLAHLHASTCLLMTRFINGHHCPNLSHRIVQNLRNLLVHPESEQNPSAREMYQQLLEHWQNVTSFLLEQKSAHRTTVRRH